MSGKFMFALPLLLAACAPASVANEAPPASAWTGQCEDWADWDKPGPPFRIHGNTFYVGTCGIGAMLIANDDGHFLIDSGTEAGADVVLANIRALGFDPADVELLLTSHEHYDHIGGMAKLQAATGADVLTSLAAQSVLQTGMADPADPQFGMHEPMTPVPVVGVFGLGNHYGYILDRVGLNMIETPGHTLGALTWTWESCDDTDDCKTIVYADSMSPVSNDTYRFSDHPEYVAAYRAGIARVAALDCDILLTPHPSASGLRDKLLADDLTSGMNCRQYAASITERLNERLAQEAATQ